VSQPRAIRVERSRLRAAAAGVPTAERNEMAVPSDCHPNPAIRWLFWSRLDAALSLAQVGAGERVLDFGTGGGVLLPTLCAAGARVTATDVQLAPAHTLVAERTLDVALLPAADQAAWFAGHAGGVDCIFALDVLEHLGEEALAALVDRFRVLLSPRGRLVLSGPTESVMYALGRRVAGFANDYHHRNVFDLDRLFAAAWKAERRVRLPPWPLPRAFVVTRYVPAPSRS
jgi:2-polyprenyl-3-methyl-5-hydroxy-6-metoxy-1,4-benzoquinol methylase